MAARPVGDKIKIGGIGGIGDGLERRAPGIGDRAGRQAVELGSHREAAAQFERALRLAGGEPPEALAARYDELAGELEEGVESAAQARAATEEFERLRAGELRDFRLVLLHGQLGCPVAAVPRP